MEYPRCHLYFLRIHTVFKLIVHIFEGNTCTGDLCVMLYVITIIIIFVSLSQCAWCDWSILQAMLYCTAG